MSESGRPAGSGSSPPRTERRDRERPYRRALLVGLLLSVVAHALLLVLSGRVRMGRLEYTPVRPAEDAAEGLRVVEVRPAPDVEAESPPEVPGDPAAERVEGPFPEVEEEREERLEAPVRLPGRPVPADPGAGEPVAREPGVGQEEALTNSERLQPRMGDRRLWVDFRDRPFQARRLEAYARADSALRAILREWLDSLQLAEDAERRARDWTIGEGDDRWGISPEGLHLGDVTIPIPFGQLLQQSGPKAREARQALEDLMEIQRQELRRELEEVADERREAMRERSREQTEDRDDDTTSTGG